MLSSTAAFADTAVSVNCVATHFGSGQTNCSGNGGAGSEGGYQSGATKTASGSAIGANGYTATMSARASYGSLGISGDLSGSSNALIGGAPLFRVDGTSHAEWTDGFTIVVPGQANGTSALVKVTQIIDIHDLSATVGGLYPTTSSKVSFFSSVKNSDVSLANACGTASASTLGQDAQCQSNTTLLHVGRNVIEQQILLPVGQIRYLTAVLDGVSIYYNPYASALSTGSTSFDAFNTAHTYLTVLTPDGSVTSTSGQSYVLPAIPEPATWALLLTGFGAIGSRLRRRVGRGLRTA
ncbi:hypothetical protein SPAN111604_09970 [Sphingomonas antarctica]